MLPQAFPVSSPFASHVPVLLAAPARHSMRLCAERREWGSPGDGKPTSRRAKRVGENLNPSLDRPSHSSPPPPVFSQRARMPSA
jgi:hypothetical protein